MLYEASLSNVTQLFEDVITLYNMLRDEKYGFLEFAVIDFIGIITPENLNIPSDVYIYKFLPKNYDIWQCMFFHLMKVKANRKKKITFYTVFLPDELSLKFLENYDEEGMNHFIDCIFVKEI